MDSEPEELCAYSRFELFSNEERYRLEEWRMEKDNLENIWWQRVFEKASTRFAGYMLYTLLVDDKPVVTFGENQAYHHDHFDCLTCTGVDLDVRPATQGECDEVATGWAKIASMFNAGRPRTAVSRSDA